MAIQNIPVGTGPVDSRNYALLPMLPSGAIPTPIAVKTVLTSAATNIALSGGTCIVISSEDYGCFYRFKTAGDTADVTSADAGNARGKVLPGTQRVEAPVTGATFLSVIGSSGTARVTVEQRA